MKKVTRTSEGLRDALFDELDGLRDGSSTPQKAQATAKIAVQIINSVRMELDYVDGADALELVSGKAKLRLGSC